MGSNLVAVKNNVLNSSLKIFQYQLIRKTYFESPCNQCRAQSIFGDTVYSCYCKLRLVTPQYGAEGTKIFDFDNPKLLEKALSGKELHRKLLVLTKKY